VPRIFISHIHEDKTAAVHLVDFLRAKLHVQPEDLFLSSNQQIQLGREWLTAISSTFQACTVVIALFSPESMRRQWVHFEAGGAFFSRRKVLLPICIGGLDPSQLGRPYCNIQAADLHAWTTGHYLVTSIWKVLRPETGALPELAYTEDDPDVLRLQSGLQEWWKQATHVEQKTA
jgi:hypothetical protein